MSVAKVNSEIIALGRAGYRAITSPYYQHILWDGWVRANYERFDELLAEGERIVGEWLAQAHGTRYDLGGREPFVWFDIFTADHERMTTQAAADRVGDRFLMSKIVHVGTPLAVEQAMQHVRFEVSVSGEHGWHGALDPVEGIVYRVERHGRVNFLCKYVRPDKIDGGYLGSVSGAPDVWNWRPDRQP